MLKIKNVNKVITTSGGTSDIINVVMMAYDVESDPQIRTLAEKLKADTVYKTCRNVWQYLIDNVNYRADSDGDNGEMIRTPARLIHDRTGDCKSYSLFTAVVLRFLGIQHVFRFTSYNGKPEATHVYVAAYDGNEEIIIDAVAAVQLNTDFNIEKKYSYKCDMANGGTKISYLAGLTQTAGVGSVDRTSDERFRVWTNERNERDITPGHAFLFAQYDLLSEEINIAPDADKAALYNQLALVSAMLWAYEYTNGDTAQLDDMAVIIAGLVKEGVFNSRDIATGARDEWFDLVLREIDYRYVNNSLPSLIDQFTYNWLLKNVIHENNYPADAAIAGIGGWTPLADALKKAGIYFIYMFIPEHELKLYPAVVARKRNTQIKLYNLIHKIDIFHSADTVRNLFRSGIIARTGRTPEDYIYRFRTQNKKSIGAITEVLVAVGAVISVIMGLIELIRAIWPNSEAAKYAVSAGAADMQNELFSGSGSGSGSGSVLKSGGGLLLGLGLITSFFFMKNKNSKN